MNRNGMLQELIAGHDARLAKRVKSKKPDV
jgi:hypothetical protein